MSRNTSRIDFSYTEDSITRIFRRDTETPETGSVINTCCYNQNEDQFLELTEPLEIPAFPAAPTGSVTRIIPRDRAIRRPCYAGCYDTASSHGNL